MSRAKDAPPWRPVPRYGVREVRPGIRVNGCFRDRSQPHGVGHNAVCVCLCAWCEDERASVSAPPGQWPQLEMAL